VVIRFETVFGARKPVIAMVHLGALPGAPLFDTEAGLAGLIKDAHADLEALQAAGVDAVMFGNENDRPYEFQVDAASTDKNPRKMTAMQGAPSAVYRLQSAPCNAVVKLLQG
jgi:predicted TIM-barrel enzyme